MSVNYSFITKSMCLSALEEALKKLAENYPIVPQDTPEKVLLPDHRSKIRKVIDRFAGKEASFERTEYPKKLYSLLGNDEIVIPSNDGFVSVDKRDYGWALRKGE